MKPSRIWTVTMLAYGPTDSRLLRLLPNRHPRREIDVHPRCVATFLSAESALRYARHRLDSECGYYNYAVIERYTVPGHPFAHPETQRWFRLVGCRKGEDLGWKEISKPPRCWRNAFNLAFG